MGAARQSSSWAKTPHGCPSHLGGTKEASFRSLSPLFLSPGDPVPTSSLGPPSPGWECHSGVVSPVLLFRFKLWRSATLGRSSSPSPTAAPSNADWGSCKSPPRRQGGFCHLNGRTPHGATTAEAISHSLFSKSSRWGFLTRVRSRTLASRTTLWLVLRPPGAQADFEWEVINDGITLITLRGRDGLFSRRWPISLGRSSNLALWMMRGILLPINSSPLDSLYVWPSCSGGRQMRDSPSRGTITAFKTPPE